MRNQDGLTPVQQARMEIISAIYDLASRTVDDATYIGRSTTQTETMAKATIKQQQKLYNKLVVQWKLGDEFFDLTEELT